MKTLFLLFVLITGPNSLVQAMTGPLQVTKDSLRITRDDGFKVHFYKGNYPTQLEIKDQKVFLTISRKDIDTRAVLEIPHHQSLPENGAFIFDGTQSGQTFLIQGTNQTQKHQSETFQGSEPCQYSREEWVCQGYGRRRSCGWETVWIKGYKQVEYYYLTTQVQLTAELKSNNGGIANFSGQESSRQQIYTYIGACF